MTTAYVLFGLLFFWLFADMCVSEYIHPLEKEVRGLGIRYVAGNQTIRAYTANNKLKRRPETHTHNIKIITHGQKEDTHTHTHGQNQNKRDLEWTASNR